jgi:2-polyprenyl-6-methoxyphenol hydroxylase-like FAD-dependent oxidoreductase
MSATEFRAQEVRAADVLVVGGGAAGLSAALHARGCDVILVTKSAFADGGSSVLAQGGIAAAIGRDDTPANHARDTQSASCWFAVLGSIGGRMAASPSEGRPPTVATASPTPTVTPPVWRSCAR